MKRRKRFAIVIGVAAAGVMALGAQTEAQTPAPAPVTCYPNSHKPATIVGTSGNDTLSGTPANDVIASRGGNDKVSGLGGSEAAWPVARMQAAMRQPRRLVETARREPLGM